ncbi:hypothetical protein S58_39810 [Bradyrhizobium oligotrophicum S58]|uniref:Uncharacterized protein n=1 Tax=Bradyrhizobium oligotrophicum S58 TaxID=1245469 RepID=M4Z963_9BRAD|nr:hypothetical protein S58_39810 [Bradyrhizobium oligotrophicum S58]
MRAERDEIGLFRRLPDLAFSAERTGQPFVVLKQCIGHERLQIAILRMALPGPRKRRGRQSRFDRTNCVAGGLVPRREITSLDQL